MDYKDTLSLPTTNFAMRGNLPSQEPKRYAKWKEQKAYQKMLNHRKNAKNSFFIHDGPPYANGNLHIGHALNKILKDIITKTHYFQGERITYTPGWDCHGLPIEQQVEKNLGKEKEKLDTLTIRKLCRDHAKKFVQIQSEEFQQLGVIGDFENPYKTMDFPFESDIFDTLCKIAKAGLLVERNKPIYWSWACQTALADAEVEYKDKQSDSIYVAFPLEEQAQKQLGISQGKLIIWTTTPWTLPANVAIAIKPEATYVLTKQGFIVGKPLLSELAQNGIIDEEVVREFSSKELEKLFAINPLNHRKSLIILGDHVSLENGTGAVHTAPGHGEDDYYVALKYDLEVLMPVDDRGHYDEQIIHKNLLPKHFLGQHIFAAQKEIIEMLGDSLLKHTVITHSYPHCWRSHKPVIYRATTQWFILMDKPFREGKTLRQIALEAIDKTTFYPENGRNRIYSMVENRPDWCISRQRDWGVPLAFFQNKKDHSILLDDAVLNHLKARFEKEGCDIWWSEEIENLLPQSHKHLAPELFKCGHILDVWFESGSTWQAVLKTKTNNPPYQAGNYPADMYLEGSDQHRGWFQSSLLLSCAILGEAPFKSILTHGFTVDEKGEKQSKSKGNVIPPETILKNQGSEILRLWVAMNDYQSDLRISANIIAQVAEQYKKIRNTLRFLLANINDLETLAPKENLSPIDVWILKTTKNTFSLVQSYFAKYDFVKGLQILMYYISNELSGIYMDLCKDSLYCDHKDSVSVQAHKSTMVLIARNLAHLLAPILTYTIDEMLDFAPAVLKEDTEDVFALTPLDWDFVDELALQGDFSLLLSLRTKYVEILGNLKDEKKVKSSLETVLYAPDLSFDYLDQWLIISEVTDTAPSEVLATFEIDGKRFVLGMAKKHKCPRCWRYLAQSEGELCQRCAEVLEKQK
ncbi:isoleucine--tRNA ligase [Helicobacter mustelae]|uniref:Isoleucine--tRNA ligase n=1 Tax=Helicobacter mustelae (strain ATCC 43772 / CCUG 25715 / CIP 103759 / LMG 18044 / NCTC 12198 / R85-136P) TaxID=679897 RepID=D3UJL8_HELM1|nr:isoleucine--tRNA ligase [Helicobacter mustelae]CBG40695.1 isoleucyl-tRNA synthetase [Helicobacter mustelae 12198]SQH72193.1 isoleucyl-tRNA synthetase [Helicobacter mustelae]